MNTITYDSLTYKDAVDMSHTNLGALKATGCSKQQSYAAVEAAESVYRTGGHEAMRDYLCVSLAKRHCQVAVFKNRLNNDRKREAMFERMRAKLAQKKE